jgi:hypothetical protein
LVFVLTTLAFLLVRGRFATKYRASPA